MHEIDYNYLKQELWSNTEALTNGANSFADFTDELSKQIAHLEKLKANSERRRLKIVARLEELENAKK